ncbi:MAG: hypothetical protein ACRDQZ_00465 [Mycobacteriales bacterium]
MQCDQSCVGTVGYDDRKRLVVSVREPIDEFGDTSPGGDGSGDRAHGILDREALYQRHLAMSQVGAAPAQLEGVDRVVAEQ